MAAQTPDDDPFGLGKLLGSLGGADLMAQLQRLMSGGDGPVNWELATQIAQGALGEDPAVESVQEAGRLADLWLDPVTTLPAGGTDPAAWTRRAWLDSTLAGWKQLVDPVASRVTAAMGGAMQQGLLGEDMLQGLPPEMAGLLKGLGPNPFAGVLDQMGGIVFGAQVGMALGALAQEVLSTSEVGVPLGPSALVPSNIAAFADGLEVPLDEVRLYLALREAAHQRLFEHVPWLRAHLYDAVDAYARGIEVDPAAIERAVSSFDPENPSAVQEALANGGAGLFELESTPAQEAALARLELALALVEGWVDTVVDQASSTTLPHAAQLRETIRRRRASGGPAEQTFATLVGLQLRPRRLREAAQLWSSLTEARGVEGRDALWAHPDLLPGSVGLDDPAGWIAGAVGPDGLTDVDGVAVRDWDAGLQALGDEPPGPTEA